MPRKPVHADPVIAALIAKLPAPGAEFSEDKQRAWLRRMADSFADVYGGNVAGDVVQPAPTAQPARPAPPPKPIFPFMVNEHGYAVTGDGKRVMPTEVAGAILYDMRGEADLGAIVWADGSTGVIGFAGEISAVLPQ